MKYLALALVGSVVGIPLAFLALSYSQDVVVVGQPATTQVEANKPQFEGLGDHSRRVTSNAEAQVLFDQGLAFLFAFNHDEAIRSFEQAAALDPECAMAHWGIAIAS